jgi:hypothetical protein
MWKVNSNYFIRYWWSNLLTMIRNSILASFEIRFVCNLKFSEYIVISLKNEKNCCIYLMKFLNLTLEIIS